MDNSDNASLLLLPFSSLSSFCLCCVLFLCMAAMMAYSENGAFGALPASTTTSPWFGSQSGGNPFAGECQDGSWIASATVYTKKNDTVDGLYAECVDAQGNVSKLVNEGDRHKDGVAGQSRGKNKSKALAGFINIGKWVLAAFLTGMIPGGLSLMAAPYVPKQVAGRQPYYKGGIAAPQGLNKVSVWTRNNEDEIAGLQFVAIDNKVMNPIGGIKKNKNYQFACPAGHVLVGMRGRSGERLDGVQFVCDRR